VRPVDIAPFLFCTRKGEGYLDELKGTASGRDSMWQRFMERVQNETKVKQRFTEHDLRAKCASDADTLDHARAPVACLQPGHTAYLPSSSGASQARKINF
jgi:hypothetical protein